MPRIRKKTTNRASTNDRAKVRHKVKESRKKKAKAAKKNPQWKSKTPKDPGIPNDFPYKDQILAEVAEQRRLAADDKERKKAAKQKLLAKAKAIARGEDVEDDSDSESAENEELAAEDEPDLLNAKGKKNLNVGADSIASLSAKLLKGELKPRPQPQAEVEEEEDEEEVPVLINRDLPNLKSVLDKADVVLEVLAAGDPLAFRSMHVEELAREAGKKVVLVVNKIDTCPRESLASWAGHLRTQHPTFLFRSSTSFLPEGPAILDPLLKKGKGKSKQKAPTGDALGAESILECLSHWAKEKKGDEPLTVAVVGVVNVGKSSLINSLLRRAVLPIYTLATSSRGPSTTNLPQEVTLEIGTEKIILIDTPGLSFLSKEEPEEEDSALDDFRARDILLRSKGRIDRLKDPTPPIAHIMTRANTEDLMLLYSLPAFAKGDPSAFLSGVARANQLVKRKGELDLTGAARIVLRDWSVGKFSRYTTPPTTSTAESSSASTGTKLTKADTAHLALLYAKDEAVLATLQTRKDMRKNTGIVKFSAGSVDPRKAAADEPWSGLAADEAEDSDDDGGEERGVESMDVDDEEQEGEEESEEEGDEDDEEAEEDADEEEEVEQPVAPVSNKQKRKRGPERSIPSPPSKKVAFAAKTAPKGSKQQRKPEEAPVKGVKSKSNLVSALKAAPQQKPLKAVQVSSKTAAKSTKSLNKPTLSPAKTPAVAAAAPVAKPKPAESKGKVANVSTKTKAKKLVAPSAKKGANEPEVYDFGKFF
ncbi:hypothetical protein B0H34DRAFT_779894 [Crassisporium funariophilum]|nr:hypothetical protein B0H34DRAFT_779894 [Crassisporium funariophilum]